MGAPAGNKNGKKAKDWERELRAALHFYEGPDIPKGQALAKIARNVVDAAIKGDWRAIEEVGNRLDGKPAQAIDLSGSIETKHVSEFSADELTEELAQVRAAINRATQPDESSDESSGLH